jgi:type II secretory pathway component HofQ
MAKKKRELTTRRMPSGAQQYARPQANSSRESPIARRMDTIGTAMEAVRRTPRTPENAADRAAKQRMLYEAVVDESNAAENARMMQRQATAEDSPIRRKEGGAMKSKKSLAPTASKRPTPRPSTAEERAAAGRADSAAKREAGMKAGGKVKKMAMGGKCRGMGAATRGGNFSRG